MDRALTEAGAKLEQNKYIYSSGVLPVQICTDLSNHLFNLHKEGKLTQDDQCPSSFSIYGDPKFEMVLQDLADKLSATLGKKVLPTYCYARLYQKGEILHKHKDRPSCEISITVTLDHDKSSIIWPIKMGEEKNIFIEKGDGVIYKGCEIEHWREPYKGEWQTQAFFHFVDAEGQYREYAFDKRQSLGSVTQIKNTTKALTGSGYFANQCDDYHPTLEVSDIHFSEEECDKIISIANNNYSEKASVGADEYGTYRKEVREVNSYSIPISLENDWIFNRIVTAVSKENANKFKFNLLGIIHGLELLHYSSETKCHYNWHVDTGPGSSTNRKLSVSVQLSDPKNYKGGELLVNDGNIKVGSFTRGSINIFPSYLLHTVTEVTEGDRWAIVIWIHGSDRFK